MVLRRVLLLALFLLGFNFLEHFAHKKTDGFSMHRIQFQEDSKTESVLEMDTSIFNQPFHYLDCGNQCYAFLSEDGQYVLKFFKYANPLLPHFLTQIPLLNRVKPFRPHRYERTLWKQKRDFQGYELAFDLFKEEAALVAVHCRPSHLPIQVKLTDKLHIEHLQDLSKTPFILQKKALPIYNQLHLWDSAKRSDGVFSLVQLLKKRIALNIQDDDVHFYSNFGFIGKTAVQIDPGHFTRGVYENPEKELQALLEPLIQWCQKHDPTLLKVIDEAVSH